MRRVFWTVLVITTLNVTGCGSFWHNLQPHRLHRLNRQPAPARDPEFSRVTPAAPSTHLG